MTAVLPGLDEVHAETRDALLAIIRAGAADGPLRSMDDPRWLDGTVSQRAAVVARAALLWALDGTPSAVAARLAEDDALTGWRVRHAGLDLHDAMVEPPPYDRDLGRQPRTALAATMRALAARGRRAAA